MYGSGSTVLLFRFYVFDLKINLKNKKQNKRAMDHDPKSMYYWHWHAGCSCCTAITLTVSSHNWTELRVLQINFTMQVGKCPSLKLLLIQVFAMYLCNTQGIQQGKQWSSCFSDQNSSMKVSGSEFLILQVNYSLHCWKYLWAFGVPVDNQTKWIDTWDKLS